MDEEMMNMGAEGTEAAQAASAEEQAGAQGEQGTEGQEQTEKKYTDADVDRIIAKKIAAERKRMQRLFEDEQQENEIETRERNVLKRELMADAKDMLISDGFPSSLATIMDYSSKEAHEESYKNVTAGFNEALQFAIKEKFRGTTPRVSIGSSKGHEELALAEAFAPPKR